MTGLQLLYIKKNKINAKFTSLLVMFALKEAFKKLNFHILELAKRVENGREWW